MHSTSRLISVVPAFGAGTGDGGNLRPGSRRFQGMLQSPPALRPMNACMMPCMRRACPCGGPCICAVQCAHPHDHAHPMLEAQGVMAMKVGGERGGAVQRLRPASCCREHCSLHLLRCGASCHRGSSWHLGPSWSLWLQHRAAGLQHWKAGSYTSHDLQDTLCLLSESTKQLCT